MNHKNLIKSFCKLTQENYPSTSDYDFSKTQNLLANFKVPISHKIIQQIESFIKTIYKISRQPNYLNYLSTNDNQHFDKIKKSNIKNNSVLMAYDFHIENENAQLIEVNTNASGFLISNQLSTIIDQKDFASNLKQSFKNEFKLSRKPIQQIAIVDENPLQQNMHLEFLMYNDLFKSWGYDSSIYDIADISYRDQKLYGPNGKKIDFIYNRFCDFYLEEDRSKDLFSAYIEEACVFSPQPREYLLLADKKRMTEWCSPEWQHKMELNSQQVNTLNQTITSILPIQSFEPEELWKERKKYFFKPSQSFGGKSVYRGKSITKKNFERLLGENTLVQKFVPAPNHTVDDNDWKYEIRAYVYQDQIQQTVVRSYQGQVTNFKTLGGGFSLVDNY